MNCVRLECNKVFENIQQFKIHIKNVHNLKINDVVQCPFRDCQAKFNRSTNFYKHIKASHKLQKGID